MVYPLVFFHVMIYKKYMLLSRNININKMKTINNPQKELHEGDYILFQKPSGPELYSYLGRVINPKTGKTKVLTDGAEIRNIQDIEKYLHYHTHGESIFLHNKGQAWWPSDIEFITNISLIDKEVIKKIIGNQINKHKERLHQDRQKVKELNKALKQIK